MNVSMKILELYARSGISLENLGLNEAVLIKKDALHALKLFAQTKTLILGGDIYRKDIVEGHFASICADWYYEGNNYLESLEVAQEYLCKLDDDLYVSFILKDL